MTKRYLVCLAVLALVVLPVIAYAIPLGSGRLMGVTSLNGGCVAGPTGGTVQAWDVEAARAYPLFTYHLRLEYLTDCANGGTDPTINVRVQSSYPYQQYWDLIAYNVAPGVYEFDFTMPYFAGCTYPVFYCTTPGDITTGLRARRNDGGNFQGHLRASYFDAGCTNPEPISGGECGTIPVEDSSWGAIKTLYE